MVFTLRDYEQVVLSKPIHPQLDEGVFREICDKYGDYALGLINRHQI